MRAPPCDAINIIISVLCLLLQSATMQNNSNSRKKALCYGVANGRSTGIYFTWEEAQTNVSGFSNAIFEGFASVAQAERFLKGHGLAPYNPGNWILKDRSPILYQNNNSNKRSGSGDKKIPAAASATKSQEAISIHSSPATPPPSTLRLITNENPAHKKPRVDLDAPQKCAPSESASSTSAMSIDLVDSSQEDVEEKVTRMTLDPIQQRAIDAAMEGKNIFLTGVAGTGKSLVTQKIVQNAKSKKQEVAVAAPTGVAAVNLNLGAQTVHSLAGVKVPQRVRDFSTMFTKANQKKWIKIEMLVIDECGMLTADFLDWLDIHIRRIRRSPLAPFGGIQLIFVGDFAQLGPVPGQISLRDKAYKPNDEAADCFLGLQECTAYAFQSVVWREANFHHIHLKKVYRQSDQDFIAALMDLRESRGNSTKVADLVRACSTPLESRPDLKIPAGITPTVLYCTNWKVDKENGDALRSLKTDSKIFPAHDTVVVDDDVPPAFRPNIEESLMKDKFFSQCQASKDLEMKVGAQVMLLQNLEDGLVNGSRGVIEAFRLCPVARNVLGGEQLIGPDDFEKFGGRRYEDLKWGMTLNFEGKIWKIMKFERFPEVKFMNNKKKIIMPALFERTQYRKGKKLLCFAELCFVRQSVVVAYMQLFSSERFMSEETITVAASLGSYNAQEPGL
jgi:hypothetical protein